MLGMEPMNRYRRLRRTEYIRQLVQETKLSVSDLVQPVFVQEGLGAKVAIESLPGIFRYSLDECLNYLDDVVAAGILAIALFPAIPESLKTSDCRAAVDPEGLMPDAIRAIKSKFPDLVIFSDVALDPYSSDGHDGLVKDGEVLNDESVDLLAEMAVVHAEAGADFVAPSDMMDGRVAAIRLRLDRAGYQYVGIMSYAVKYASSLYGPFRDALDSAPRAGDKKSYQMDSANFLEALREIDQDVIEGADIIMIKPAIYYLDVVQSAKQQTTLPVAAYHVSGEYAMIKAASQQDWLDADAVMMEALLSIKRAGADLIFTYAALEVADLL